MSMHQAVEANYDEAVQNEDGIRDELEPGHTLMQGQYTIDAFLNAGGFGITYLARNSLDRKVVIKECFPGSYCRRTPTSVIARSSSHVKEFSSIVRKFVEEAHSLAKVKHPNIVGVHQVFEENETAYMALDFIEGRDLLDLIEGQGTMPKPAEIETILRKLLDAISAVHEQDMLHRDISPDNILLTSEMEPILIDFGAARRDAAQEKRIKSELRVIKDGYSPQEFYVAGAEQGPFSDLYALAATFYHLITGELPADSQTRMAAVAAGEDDPYKSVVGRVSDYSEPFLLGIDRALAVLPKDRIASARHWLDLLNGATSSGTVVKLGSAKSNGPTPPSESTINKKARVLAAIALAIPIVGAAVVLNQSDEDLPVASPVAEISEPDTTVSVAAADPSPTALPVPSSGEVVETDLTAALNIPSSDTITPIASAETSALFPTGPIAPASVEGPDASDASDVAALQIATLESLVSASALDTEILSEDSAIDIESFALPQVTSAWSVDLTGALSGTSGKIYAIDGLPFDGDTKVETVLHTIRKAPTSGTVELSVLTGSAEDEAVVETITVPVVHKTSFADGATFEAREIDGTWTTIVTDAPTGSDFQIDDILVGDVATEVLFDTRTALPDILVQAKAQNLEHLTLAVRRGGIMSPVSLVVPR